MVLNRYNCRVLILVCFFLLFMSTPDIAQTNYYIIYLKNKQNTIYSVSQPQDYLSTRAIERRQKQNIPIDTSDLPVNPNYIEQLKNTGATVLYSLKWFNAVVVEATPDIISDINTLSIVQSKKKLTRRISSTQQENYTLYNNQWYYVQNNELPQLSMIGANEMHNMGYHGENIRIAVLDAGFKNVNILPVFSHLFTHGKIVYSYDIVNSEENIYDDHSHGTNVLSLLAAHSSSLLKGMVSNAHYMLFRTEDISSEYEIEEANWAKAAEIADSCGADIISSSLGYSTFDLLESDHSYSDLNGNTTLITKAANIAFSKGMLVINSVGNEGNNPWQYLLAPADGYNVIAVGAVKSDGTIASFSSHGPSYDGRVKPDLVAMGESVTVYASNGDIITGNGTSFACPLISGLAAGLWQAFPQKKNTDIRKALLYSASHSHNPNYRYGYGIPNFKKAFEYLKGDTTHHHASEELSLFPIPLQHEHLTFSVPFQLLNKKAVISVFDIIGNVVFSKTIILTTYHITVDLTNNLLKSGIYIFNIVADNYNQSKRFVKY